tara:strand:- start:3086 stop:3811 length:726 start_codon:yes stop_codon:yes gene_type:complete
MACEEKKVYEKCDCGDFYEKINPWYYNYNKRYLGYANEDEYPQPPIEWITDLQKREDELFTVCCAIPQFWTIIERALNSPPSAFYYKKFLNDFLNGQAYKTNWGRRKDCVILPSESSSHSHMYKYYEKDKKKYTHYNWVDNATYVADGYKPKVKKHLNERYHTHTKTGKLIKCRVERLKETEPKSYHDTVAIYLFNNTTFDAQRIVYNTFHREKYDHIKKDGDLEEWSMNDLKIWTSIKLL